jgi:hypothetical protein
MAAYQKQFKRVVTTPALTTARRMALGAAADAESQTARLW